MYAPVRYKNTALLRTVVNKDKIVKMKVVVLVTCIILGVNAYQFDDALYNQFLAKDFESLADEDIPILNHRARRNTQAPNCPPPKRLQHLCCGADEMEAVTNELRGLKKECMKEVTGHELFHAKPFDPFSCDDIEKRKKELTCVEQCVYKKKDLADENGNLKKDTLKKFVADHYKMDWMKPKLDEILSKCLVEAKEATGKMDKNACNPASVKFSHCLYREIQLGCSDDKIENRQVCAIVRSFAKTASFIVVQPQHH